MESSLFGIHEGSACFTVWGTYKEGTPLDRKNPHSSLISLYLQPTVRHPVHVHKGKSRYVCFKVIESHLQHYLKTLTYRFIFKNFSNQHCLKLRSNETMFLKINVFVSWLCKKSKLYGELMGCEITFLSLCWMLKYSLPLFFKDNSWG